tara:strand:- start:318 stop:632 length:315 start_codon:yes stop_codon:yes gene_type:complete
MFNRNFNDAELANKLGSDGITATIFSLLVTVVAFIAFSLIFKGSLPNSIILIFAMVIGGFIGLKSSFRLKQKRASEIERLRKLRQESIDQERSKQISEMEAREK